MGTAGDDARAGAGRHRQTDAKRAIAALVDSSSDFIAVSDGSGRIDFVNPAGREMVGLTPVHDVRGTHIQDYYAPDQRDFVTGTVLRSTVEDGRWRGESQFRDWRGGPVIDVSLEHFVIRQPAGRILGIGTIARDVSELKRQAGRLTGGGRERRASDAIVDGIIAASPEAVATVDGDLHITQLNRAAERMFRYGRADAIGAPLEVLFPHRFRAVHRERLRAFVDGRSSRMTLGDGAGVIGQRRSGEEFPIEVTLSRLDVEGRVVVTVTLRDGSDQARHDAAQRFLADAAAVLASSLDAQETLDNIARLAVRHLADLCIIDGIDEHGRIRRLKVLSRDEQRAILSELLMQTPPGKVAGGPIRSAIDGRRTVIENAVSGDAVSALSDSVPQQRGLRAAGVSAIVAVPLIARGTLEGVLTLLSCTPSHGYDAADVRLAEELAQRSALAIAHSRLYGDVQQATRIRDDVLAVVSHDLKNPIVTIGLLAELLGRAEKRDAATLQQFAADIKRSVDAMHVLIDDLVDFARVHSASFSVEQKAIALQSVIKPVVERMRAVADARRVRLEIDVPAQLPRVAGDARRLAQVASNLVENAINFTPARGTVSITARRQGDAVLISVRDSGLGIPPEHLSRIFDRFWQTSPGDRGGAGLGLSIARRIVETHGGRIWAESGVGTGSTFSFTVPVAIGAEMA